MSEADFILKRGQWRFFKNNLGDSLYDIQFLLTLPHDKVNVYCESKIKSYQEDCPKLVDLLRLFDNNNKVKLMPPGELVPETTNNPLYKVRGMSQLRRRPDVKLNLKLNEKELKPNYDFLRNFNYSLDFSKTIGWGRRIFEDKYARVDSKLLVEVPDKILKMWEGYNFLNLGTRFDKDGVYDFLYDLDTLIWILKSTHAFVGSDSGVTHLAMVVKDPKDIYFYGENSEGVDTKKSWAVNSFKNTGINFLV
jgi:hypothetical protein